MLRLSKVEERDNVERLRQDLREAYSVLDTFGAYLKDNGDDELAARIFRVTNIVGDCSNFLNNFVKISGVFSSDGVSVPIVDTIMKTGRQENLNDNQ